MGINQPTTMNVYDYQVDLYLRQEWKDGRLQHPNITSPLDLNDPHLVQAIWKPEVYFPNAKDAEFQFVTVPNVLVRISPDGNILYMLRLKLTFACMMELSRFPLDVQVCTMEIGSFSKTTQELNLSWKRGDPIKIYRGLKMPQFNIINNETDRCHEDFQIGNYSCLRALITLERNIGFHLVQSYLPSILIVVISWMGFWMDTDSVPARTCLGVTTLLTVSNQASDLGLTSRIAKFADDTELDITAANSEDVETLREDLMKLGEWSSKWQMPFNCGKCKVMHIGYTNPQSD
ncbi:glycine receptor subunit alpha-2-like [Palaemon carinicauda]|uniref:glycine receptor subunit alpha-2-like n=1 Tax=Palaemon carinicauda TaxID=392227 RepID=UPI0035B6279C